MSVPMRRGWRVGSGGGAAIRWTNLVVNKSHPDIAMH